MAVENTRFTPARRGPSLGDATGGTSERPASRTEDPVQRNVGWRTEDVRLTAGGTDADGGHSALYNLGPAGKKSVGIYRVTSQGAASATAEPLGAITWARFEVREQTAGVFNVAWTYGYDGLIAAEDATQDESNIPVANRKDDADALDWSASASADDAVAIIVVTSTQATDIAAAGLTQGIAPSAGDLCLVDTRGASTRVYTITREA